MGITPALSQRSPYGKASVFRRWNYCGEYRHIGGSRIHGGGIGWSGKRILSAGKRGGTGLFQRRKFLKEGRCGNSSRKAPPSMCVFPISTCWSAISRLCLKKSCGPISRAMPCFFRRCCSGIPWNR